jgi:hypothetical protein
MLIDYKCPDCNKTLKKYYKNYKDIQPTLICDCGKELKRILAAPSSKATQVIDNGLQSKQVEILNEVVEKERLKAENL